MEDIGSLTNCTTSATHPAESLIEAVAHEAQRRSAVIVGAKTTRLTPGGGPTAANGPDDFGAGVRAASTARKFAYRARDNPSRHRSVAMGRRGPPSTPTRLRVLTGNPGKRPINAREPQPIGPPQKPDFITGSAAEDWDRVIASMPPGFFTAADTPTLAVFSLTTPPCSPRRSPGRAYPQGADGHFRRIRWSRSLIRRPALSCAARVSWGCRRALGTGWRCRSGRAASSMGCSAQTEGQP